MHVEELLPRARPGVAGLDRRERALRAVLRATVRPAMHPRTPPSATRRAGELLGYLTMLAPSARRGVRLRQVDLGGVPTEIVTPAGVADWTRTGRCVVVYLHGGGHRVGSPRTHRAITTHLARAMGTAVLVPDYALAPERPFPAGLHDAVTVIAQVRRWTDQPIVVAGDSAGGNLALALALRLRETGQPMPAALGLISPWTDLRPSVAGSKGRTDDAELWPDPDGRDARTYAGDRLDDPLVSPVLADLAGLPPILVQTGVEELLRDDSERLAELATAAGVDVTLERYGGMWHVHQLAAGLLPAADLALDRLATFLIEAAA